MLQNVSEMLQKTIEAILYQNNELLKFNHYFDQNRMEKKTDGYKITEHKEKGNDSKPEITNMIQAQTKYQGKIITLRQKTISVSCQL